MKLNLGSALSVLLAGSLPGAALAQNEPPAGASTPAQQAEEEGDESEIIVTGGVLRGAVAGDIKPEQQLTPADIRARGVSTIAELLDDLALQTGSARGRGGGMPVVLLNGRRISSFAEIRDLPAEAIERVDILPEEAALKYGYRADQRVVNFVLRRRFRALTTELGLRAPTAGGNSEKEFETGLALISNDKRINLNAEYESTSGILESERNVLPRTEESRYRTLVSPSQSLQLNGTFATPLSQSISLSLNARLEEEQRKAVLGLPSVTLTVPAANPFAPGGVETSLSRYIGDGALTRSSENQTAHLGFTLNGDLKPWRWSMTGNFDRVTSESLTARGFDPLPLQARLDANDPGFNPFAPIPLGQLSVLPSDRARSVSTTGTLDALTSGPLFKGPAGNINASFRVTGSTSNLDSDLFRAGVARSGSVGRDRVDGQANIDIPIARRNGDFLSAIGDLTLNGNVEIEHLSDFGTLKTTGYGANWSPVPELRFLVSVTDEEGAPTAQQLGDPVIATPNVRTFDFVTGQTVDITTITGGNPLLGSDSRHVFKLGFNTRPFSKLDFNLNADWVRSTIRNQIASFPAATAQIEAAFPGRFVRDADGMLLSIDQRAVNFESAHRSELRWGFNLSIPVMSAMEKRMRAARAAFEKARDEAEAQGKPLPNPRDFFQGLGPGGRQGQNPPQSIFGGPMFGGPQGGRGGRDPGAGGPGGRGPRGFGGGRFGGGGNQQGSGRIQFSLYHSWRFQDEVVIGPGLPVLDYLNGAPVGNTGGRPRHEVEMQAGFTRGGLGFRLNGKWQSGTQVIGGLPGATDTLDFSSLATLGARLFVAMDQQVSLVRKNPWLRGVRVNLSVDNIFDTRLKVTDETGTTPLGYQRDLLDPTGRTVRLTIRKLFR